MNSTDESIEPPSARVVSSSLSLSTSISASETARKREVDENCAVLALRRVRSRVVTAVMRLMR